MSRAPRCPICGKDATDSAQPPFCSPRCRDVDMGRWLSGQYRVPTEEAAPAPPAEEKSNGRSPE